MSGPDLLPIYLVNGIIIQVGFITYNNSKSYDSQWSVNKTCFLGFLTTVVANAAVFLALGKY